MLQAGERLAFLAGGGGSSLAEAGRLLADYTVDELARTGVGEKWFDVTAQFGIASVL